MARSKIFGTLGSFPPHFSWISNDFPEEFRVASTSSSEQAIQDDSNDKQKFRHPDYPIDHLVLGAPFDTAATENKGGGQLTHQRLRDEGIRPGLQGSPPLGAKSLEIGV